MTGFDLAGFEKVLDYLGRELDPSILIGGWATQLRVGGDISKDIDLIVADKGVRSRLKTTLEDYSENRHHSGGLKVRGTVNQIHIDAYVPHESRLGTRLQLDVAALTKYVGPETLRGWQLLSLEAHLVTKFAALLDRPDSEKGLKDAREISALMGAAPNPQEAVTILLDCSRRSSEDLTGLLAEVFELYPLRAGLNKSDRREVASQRRQWLDELARRIRRGLAPSSS